jgi:hypothetical protein
MAIREPDVNSGPPSDGEIRLTNRFCDLVIESKATSGIAGIGGYALMIGLPQDRAQQEYVSVHYLVKARASFTRYLIGHPDMAAYREWAEGIITGLTRDFNEETLFRQASESFLLQAHATSPMLMPPIGPVGAIQTPTPSPPPNTTKPSAPKSPRESDASTPH